MPVFVGIARTFVLFYAVKSGLNVSANHRMIFEIAHHPLPINQDGSLDAKSVTDVRIMEIIDYH